MDVHFKKTHSENVTCALCDLQADDVENLDIHLSNWETYKCNTSKFKKKKSWRKWEWKTIYTW